MDDIAYLARSEHRVPTLVALTVRPRSRSELWEMAGVSSSTIRRTLGEFEDRDWIRRDEYRYEATQLGAHVASAMADLIERIETERQLRDVWEWLPSEEPGFAVDMWTDAVVTAADADDPYRPVNRFVSLLESSARLRFVGLDIALLEPSRDALCERVEGGMEAELIAPPRVANHVRSSCPEQFATALESGNLTVRLNDDLPSYGVGIFDDRTAIAAFDPDGVTVRVLVDTDTPAAREWAESAYTTYRRTTPTFPLEPTAE